MVVFIYSLAHSTFSALLSCVLSHVVESFAYLSIPLRQDQIFTLRIPGVGTIHCVSLGRNVYAGKVEKQHAYLLFSIHNDQFGMCYSSLAPRVSISPISMALQVKYRRADYEKPKLAGVFPIMRPGIQTPPLCAAHTCCRWKWS